MNAFAKFAVTGAAVLAFSATAVSSQAAVFLGFQQDGGAIVTVDSGASFAVFAGGFGNFELNVFSGTDGVYPQLLGTSGHARNLGGGDAGVLDVYVTVTDITQLPPAGGFFSSFANNVLPAGWTLQTRTYADAGNGLYGGALLSDTIFNSIGTFTHTNFAAVGPGNYSVTARYTITAPTDGEVLGNIAIAAIPEPATWALMIMGFGGAGAMLRSQRRRLVNA